MSETLSHPDQQHTMPVHLTPDDFGTLSLAIRDSMRFTQQQLEVAEQAGNKESVDHYRSELEGLRATEKRIFPHRGGVRS